MNTFGTIITQNTNTPIIIIIIGFGCLLSSWLISIVNDILDHLSCFSFITSIIGIVLFIISCIIIGTGIYCKHNTKNGNHNSSITQSKANITMALNDKYQDINNCNISDDKQGSFSSKGTRYNFHVNDNTLYIIEESTYNDTNTIQIIDGKNY